MHHEVVAGLIVRSNRVLLGQRSAGRRFYPGVWDLFGGHMEAGEGQPETLVRELQEELGITPTGWKYLQTISLPPGEDSGPVTVHLYLITAWTGIPANRQPKEHSAIGWPKVPGTNGRITACPPGLPHAFRPLSCLRFRGRLTLPGLVWRRSLTEPWCRPQV